MRVEEFVKQAPSHWYSGIAIVLISLFTDRLCSHTFLCFLNLFLFDLYKMNNVPSDVVDKPYRYSHQMQFSRIMKQLQLHHVHSAFNVSWDYLDYAHYYLNGVRIPCIDINNIEASSLKLLNLIHYDNEFFYVINIYFDLRYIRWDRFLIDCLEYINIIS